MLLNNITSKVFNAINSNIRIIRIGKNTLFNISDLSTKLSYSSSQYLKQYYCYKSNEIKLYLNDYVDFNGLIYILNKCRKPNCKKLAQEILSYANIDLPIIIMPNRVEIDIYNSIKDYYYNNPDIIIISNKKIDKYYPDIIIKKNTDVVVIIEINEHNHSFCEKRMEIIKKKLNCENFLNINPHDSNFSTGKLLKSIGKFISN